MTQAQNNDIFLFPLMSLFDVGTHCVECVCVRSKESTKWRQTSLLYKSGISWSTGGRVVDSSDTQVYVLMCVCCFWKGKKQENCDRCYRGGSYTEIPKCSFSASVYSWEYTEVEKHCVERFTFPCVASWASSCPVWLLSIVIFVLFYFFYSTIGASSVTLILIVWHLFFAWKKTTEYLFIFVNLSTHFSLKRFCLFLEKSEVNQKQKQQIVTSQHISVFFLMGAYCCWFGNFSLLWLTAAPSCECMGRWNRLLLKTGEISPPAGRVL